MTDPAAVTQAPRLHGVLVTYRRPRELSASVEALLTQDTRLETLVVVDNDPMAENEKITTRLAQHGIRTHYLPAPENLGPAGGFRLGMEHLLRVAHDDDWLVMFDDDDPLREPTLLSELSRFGQAMYMLDPLTAAVGLKGARFRLAAARPMRVPLAELTGPVRVDHLHGGFAPCYRVGAVRQVGTFRDELFWGFEELEYGLRITEAGFAVYMHGALWRRLLDEGVYQITATGPAFRLRVPDWRRYYTFRNLLHVLIQRGRRVTARRVWVTRGVLKPLANLPVRPKYARISLRMHRVALRDAFADRMGRTVEPDGRTPW